MANVVRDPAVHPEAITPDLNGGNPLVTFKKEEIAFVYGSKWKQRYLQKPRIRAHWVQPEVVVQVAFIEWTVHGKLRHGRFQGIREDKAARDVVREMP